MSFLGQCVLGTLAAVGLICILKTVYDIIVPGLPADGRAELFLYGDGSDARSLALLESAERLRRQLLPAMTIVFVDTAPTAAEAAARAAARYGMGYQRASDAP